LHIFDLLFDYLISYLYICVLKLTLGKIIISANFSLFSAFQCEASGWTWLTVWMQAVLSIASLASGLSGCIGIMSEHDPYRCLSVSLLYHVMCFSQISPEILAFFAHFFSLHGICYVLLCSFKVFVVFRILDYLLIVIFS
jgi:hypothetical protein